MNCNPVIVTVGGLTAIFLGGLVGQERCERRGSLGNGAGEEWCNDDGGSHARSRRSGCRGSSTSIVTLSVMGKLRKTRCESTMDSEIPYSCGRYERLPWTLTCGSGLWCEVYPVNLQRLHPTGDMLQLGFFPVALRLDRCSRSCLSTTSFLPSE